MGPELSPSTEPNTSNAIVIDICKGKFPMKMNLAWGVVDVRDVALAHLLAMENKNAKGRHIVAAETVHMSVIIDYIDEICRTNGLVTKTPHCPCDCACCCCFIWCASWTEQKGTGDFLRTNINETPMFDNTKIKSYGLNFRSPKQTIKDTLLWAAENNFIAKKK